MADPAEDLIDYDEEEPIALNESAQITATDHVTSDTVDAKKGSYVGIHATGFRDFLLKPELLRAIVDCGFEHPSEGIIFSLHCHSNTRQENSPDLDYPPKSD